MNDNGIHIDNDIELASELVQIVPFNHKKSLNKLLTPFKIIMEN